MPWNSKEPDANKSRIPLDDPPWLQYCTDILWQGKTYAPIPFRLMDTLGIALTGIL